MKKFAVLALIGLVAAVSGKNYINISKRQIERAIHDLKLNAEALEEGLEKDETLAEKFFKKSNKPLLGATASQVSWSIDSSCPNKADISDPKAIPDPPIVGKNVALALTAVWNQQVDVRGLYVNVLFTAKGASTPVVLFKQDYKAKTPMTYEEGEEMNEGIDWLVPAFAPLGHYHVTVSVHGEKVDDKHLCQIAQFDIDK